MRLLSLLTSGLICALVSLLLSACGGADYRPYPYFDRVEVVTAPTVAEMPTALTKDDMSKQVPKAAATGAAAGLGLSLMCGPWFLQCAGIWVPYYTVGAPGIIFVGMSPEEADQINTYFETLPKRRNLNQELVVAVSAVLPQSRLATTSGDARLALGFDRIQIYQEANREFSLKFTVGANMEWGQATGKPGNVQRNYNCHTEYRKIDLWLADKAHLLDEAFDLCLEKIAQDVKSAVMKRAPSSNE